MKTTRNTPDQLILENTPWVIAICLVIFILIFVAVGLVMLADGDWGPAMAFFFVGGGAGVAALFAFVRRTQLILDRPRNLIELRRKSLYNQTVQTFELIHLKNAVVESMRSNEAITYRATLVISGGMQAGHHPITLVYSSGTGADRAVAAINAWLDSAAAPA
jgi:hypothetical protein